MPDAAFFQPELFEFLRQLKRHNDREWFAKNKVRYEQVVRDPALRFIAEFQSPLSRISLRFVADPRPTRGSLFRIYRDTRFAADKRPFKTHVGMHFLHAGGKDVHAPLFYLHLEPRACFAAAGVWHPDNRTLTRIRVAIVQQPAQWAKVTRKLELEGDSLTRPPRG
ncbi:MAG: TIGR02453 family protein, partial [Candidatus Korobacteraceae bacterium]